MLKHDKAIATNREIIWDKQVTTMKKIKYTMTKSQWIFSKAALKDGFQLCGKKEKEKEIKAYKMRLIPGYFLLSLDRKTGPLTILTKTQFL